MGKSTFSGPVAGAYHQIYCWIDDGGTHKYSGCIPPGMEFVCFGTTLYASANTNFLMQAGTEVVVQSYQANRAYAGPVNNTEYISTFNGSAVDSNGNVTITDDLGITCTGTFAGMNVIFHGYIREHTTTLASDGAIDG